jgi:hypothetical protein
VANATSRWDGVSWDVAPQRSELESEDLEKKDLEEKHMAKSEEERIARKVLIEGLNEDLSRAEACQDVRKSRRDASFRP